MTEEEQLELALAMSASESSGSKPDEPSSDSGAAAPAAAPAPAAVEDRMCRASCCALLSKPMTLTASRCSVAYTLPPHAAWPPAALPPAKAGEPGTTTIKFTFHGTGAALAAIVEA